MSAAIPSHQTHPSLQNSDPEIEADLAAGTKLRQQGRMPQAIAVYAREIRLAQSRGNVSGEARGFIRMGVAQLTNSQYTSAMASLATGTTLAEKLGNLFLAGSASGDVAEVYSQMGDWQGADLASKQSVGFLRQVDPRKESRQPSFLARALESHAEICFHLNKFPEGYRDSAEALTIAKKIGDQERQVAILDIRGAAFTRQSRVPEADKALSLALSLSAGRHYEALPFVNVHLAELELKRTSPDLTRALRLVDDALRSSNPMFKSGRQYYAIHIRAQILELSGDKSAALPEYLRAVTIANGWRLGALPGDTTSTQTVATLEEVYADYAHLAAEIALSSNDNQLAINALEILAENRAAGLREQLRTAYSTSGKLPDEYFFLLSQLQSAQAQVTLGNNNSEERSQLNRIRTEISNIENRIGIKPDKLRVPLERNPHRNSLKGIQQMLTSDQVLISISSGKSQSYLWAVTGKMVALSRIPSQSELKKKAATFTNAVHDGMDSASSAAELSRALFAGLPADVWNRSEWMVVADGPLLNGVPFCALPNLTGPQVHRPLIEGKTLRFLPSELMLLDRPPPAPVLKTSHTGFVGIGDPIYNLADARMARPGMANAGPLSSSITLARLVGSDHEIRSAAIESRNPDPVLLLGNRATRENLTLALANHPGIVHFAVHVVSPPNEPQQAALALSLRKDRMPELLTPEIVASFKVPGSLVVLSGCSSSQGMVIPGAGLIGLSRAWLLAGASAVVVSSWPTPDDSGRFFSSFYKHLDQIKSGDTGQRSALALRQTQLDMFHGTGYQSSPAFWGAFAVISKE